MTSWIEIALARGGYPAYVIIKSSQNLSAGRKMLRSSLRLLVGGVGITSGLLSPSWAPKELTEFLSVVLQESFPFIPWVNHTIGLSLSAWLMCDLALITVKHAYRLIHCKAYGVTNSEYHLSHSAESKLVNEYLIDEPLISRSDASQQVRVIFNTLVCKISKAKQLSQRNSTNRVAPYDSKITKSELKYVLQEFKAGNLDPYDNLMLSERLSQELAREKLINEQKRICQLFRNLKISLRAEIPSEYGRTLRQFSKLKSKNLNPLTTAEIIRTSKPHMD